MVDRPEQSWIVLEMPKFLNSSIDKHEENVSNVFKIISKLSNWFFELYLELTFDFCDATKNLTW